MNRHLTTEEIEEYTLFDGKRSANGIKVHLNGCPECRKNVAEQAEVHHLLKKLKPEKLSTDFSEQVLRRIGFNPLYSPLRWIGLWYLIPVIVIGTGLVFLWETVSGFDYAGESLSKNFTNILMPMLEQFTHNVIDMSQWVQHLHGVFQIPGKSVLLVSASLLVLMFYYFLDRAISKRM